MKTLGSFNIAYWLRHMWGHTDFCTCPICASLRRVLPLIGDGTRLPGFAGLALNHLRQLEGELRDIYEHCLRESRGVPANRQAAAVPPGQAPSEPKPPKEEAAEAPPESAKVRESKAEVSQPQPEKPAKELPLQLSAKSKPPAPPTSGSEVVAKVETHSDPDNLVDVEEGREEGSPVTASGSKRPHQTPHSRSRKRHRSRSRRREKDKKRSRSRSRRRRRGDKGAESAPRSKGGRERKSRREEVASPHTPPKPPPRRPRSPSGGRAVQTRASSRGQNKRGTITALVGGEWRCPQKQRRC